jgi:hypothetical protein
MVITGGQLVAHLVGDYVLQSRWMAESKTRAWPQAIAHGFCYTLPFAFLTQTWWQLLLIGASQAIFDRLKLSWYVLWLRNFIAPPQAWPGRSELRGVEEHGWLRVVVDNTCHLLINAVILSL